MINKNRIICIDEILYANFNNVSTVLHKSINVFEDDGKSFINAHQIIRINIEESCKITLKEIFDLASNSNFIYSKKEIKYISTELHKRFDFFINSAYTHLKEDKNKKIISDSMKSQIDIWKNGCLQNTHSNIDGFININLIKKRIKKMTLENKITIKGIIIAAIIGIMGIMIAVFIA